MIPYDDLVVALATWRARQGLPVAQPMGATPAPTPLPRAPSPPPPAARVATPSAARVGPPSAPPRPAPPHAPVSSDDFDEGEGALVEVGSYDGGDDYVVPFGGVAGGVTIDQAGEATAIGAAPEPPMEGLLVPKRGKRNPDR